MRIVAVGDSYMPSEYFRRAMAPLLGRHDVTFVEIDASRSWRPQTDAEAALREYQGSPAELTEMMAGVEVLVVHGAPVTADVIAASGALRAVCCARGGPVNVDVAALERQGVSLFTTPGKNAEAVADLTVGFLVMLSRRLPSAQRFLAEGGVLKDNWEGARFIGRDLRGGVLGLVGCGQVGRRVAKRVTAFSMDVLVFDPFVEAETAPGIKHLPDLDELLSSSDFVSLHARATKDNERLFDDRVIGRMKHGACLLNTARESLVDEEALDRALQSGHLAGAALDVFTQRPSGGRHPLLRHPNVILTPHLGGATTETLAQGAEMVAAQILALECQQSGSGETRLDGPGV